jgi:hypothetical protein
MFKELYLALLNDLSKFGELEQTSLYNDWAYINIKKGNEVYNVTIRFDKVEEDNTKENNDE